MSVAAVRRLWLVRHGETEGQSSIRFHGRNDVPLSDLGRHQIRTLAPLFAGLSPLAVVHSPLVRASESAEILTKAHGWKHSLLVCDERLAEISFGDCEGLTAQEIEARFPAFWQQHQRGETEGFPGGERRLDFAARTGLAARAWMEGPAGDVVVVAHRGTVRQVLRTVLGLAFEHKDPRPDLRVRLGSLSVARRDPPWQIEMLDFAP